MATVLSFGTIKTILTYVGQSIAPTTLDWFAGTFLTAVFRRQEYTGSACTKAQIHRSRSSKLIMHLLSAIAAAVCGCSVY
ncbi:hypothetical protein V8E53_010337 [Lactarius tabidus]